MKEFNPDLLLPQEMTIDSVDEHLYRIGSDETFQRTA